MAIHARNHETNCFCNLCLAVEGRALDVSDIKRGIDEADTQRELNTAICNALIHIIDTLEELRGERL